MTDETTAPAAEAPAPESASAPEAAPAAETPAADDAPASVATPEDAASVAAIADGVIVGSAIVKQIAAHQQKPEMVKQVADFVRSLKIAMRAAQPVTH